MSDLTNATFFATVSAKNGCADVIFVHGLTGDPHGTWSSAKSEEAEGGYWPLWLASDLPHLNYYTLGYPASLFAQWAKKEMSLFQRAKNILEVLAGYEFGGRPVVFICHSLGGLLVKQILRTAKESTDNDWHRIADSCHGILFLATPHNGSSLANLLKAFSGCFASSHVEKLLEDTSDLDELNASFRALCQTKGIHVTAYHEMHKAYKLSVVVDAKSADPGVGASMPIPVDADHLTICKPQNRDSVIYLSVKRKLKGLLPNVLTSPEGGYEAFSADGLEQQSESDRRDLLQKMTAAGREHEYGFANDSQNKFARDYVRQGLKTVSASLYNSLLADIEQRFQSLIYHPLICMGADSSVIAFAIQSQIIDPLCDKYSDRSATSKTIMNALYFLTERCHIRWDRP